MSNLYTTNLERAALLTSELAFTCNTVYLARAAANVTYNYLFDVPPALHGSDLAYTFGSASSNAADVVQSVRVSLQEYLTNFTQFGDPNGGASRRTTTRRPSVVDGGKGVETRFWRYGREGMVLRLGIDTFEMVADPAANGRCQWLQQALYV